MKPVVKSRHSGEFIPALEDSKGNYYTAPFTTFDENYAMEYATFAAEKNPHDNINEIVWPSRYILNDIS
jgi:hypothetical protein